MSDTVIVACLSLFGTVIGSGLGVIASNKLVQYRLEQLEKKVQAHNNLVERTYKIEGHLEECMHDIKELKGYHKPG
jgi:hypothetical protein